MDRTLKIFYFLEDRAHEESIKKFVTRIARDEFSVDLSNRVLSGRGGNRFIGELKRFLHDYNKISGLPDLLIVIHDSDCKSKTECNNYQTKIKELNRLYTNHQEMKDISVFCIPCPYIERWLVEDIDVIREIAGSTNIQQVPFRCEKGYYKGKLKEFFKEFDVYTGLEYAGDIVEKLSIQVLCRANSNFQHFITDLRNAFRCIVRLVDNNLP